MSTYIFLVKHGILHKSTAFVIIVAISEEKKMFSFVSLHYSTIKLKCFKISLNTIRLGFGRDENALACLNMVRVMRMVLRHCLP